MMIPRLETPRFIGVDGIDDWCLSRGILVHVRLAGSVRISGRIKLQTPGLKESPTQHELNLTVHAAQLIVGPFPQCVQHCGVDA